jgi:hypothetical protein
MLMAQPKAAWLLSRQHAQWEGLARSRPLSAGWAIHAPTVCFAERFRHHIRQIAPQSQLFDFGGALPVRVSTPWLPVFRIYFHLDM